MLSFEVVKVVPAVTNDDSCDADDVLVSNEADKEFRYGKVLICERRLTDSLIPSDEVLAVDIS